MTSVLVVLTCHKRPRPPEATPDRVRRAGVARQASSSTLARSTSTNVLSSERASTAYGALLKVSCQLSDADTLLLIAEAVTFEAGLGSLGGLNTLTQPAFSPPAHASLLRLSQCTGRKPGHARRRARALAQSCKAQNAHVKRQQSQCLRHHHRFAYESNTLQHVPCTSRRLLA